MRTSSPKSWIPWIALAWLAAMPAIAHAQASITGVVKDTSGAVLPGVTVEAASPALIEKVRSAVTDGTGQYRIENLRPGVYSVTFTLPGFNTFKREGVELTGTFTATINADLRVGTLEETITVTGETPTVDVQTTARQRVIDREILDSIPTGRSEFSLGVLIPGVTSSGGQDVGAAGTQSAFPALGVHGSSSSDTTHTLNGVGMNILATTGGYSVVRVNPAATQEMAMDTAAGDVESSAGGVRINRIPREGGNTFNGTFFGSFANSAMQGSNFTQDLRDRGLRTPNSINKNWEVNPGFGGPIKRDRLWFYGSFMHRGASQYVAGLFYDRDPLDWTFDPAFSRPVTNDQEEVNGQIRLTWQTTPRNKVGVTWYEAVMCFCPLNASLTSSVEAEVRRPYPMNRIVQTDWTSPLTNRLLLEVGGTLVPGLSVVDPWTGWTFGRIGVLEQSTGMAYRARATGTHYRMRAERSINLRGAVSYITGAHAFKVGTDHTSGYSTWTSVEGQELNYRFNNGVPNQLTQVAVPFTLRTNVDHKMGLFAQDRWTMRGLTLTYGGRYDYYANSFPEQRVGPALFAPRRNIAFPPQKALAYHDVTTRLGASYDPFGTGKTAIKVSINKYLTNLGAESFAEETNPIRNLVVETTRSWTDANRDFVANCELTNPLANGECGPMDNAAFGGVSLGATYDLDLLRGWGRRGYNWELSAGVQRELVPRVSADVAYFRRWFGNFTVNDNRATRPTDFDPFSITAPLDPRLPGGGGYVISGLYDIKPAKFGVPTDTFVTLSTNYGTRIQYWHGVDASVSARLRQLLLQGGTSTGRQVTDNCEIAAKVNNPSSLYCRVTNAFLTQLKFLGSYTVPRVDVQVSAALQSLPGPPIQANYNAPNAEVAPSLGRNLAGGARNVRVNLIEPGTMYGERMNQLDIRVAKVLRFGSSRTQVGIDLYNVLNSNAVLSQNNTYGPVWLQPNSILLARFVKVGVQFDF
jgi:hypothetical protein